MRRPFLPMLLRAIFPRMHPGSGAMLLGTVGLVCGLSWWSPLSPLAIGRADGVLAAGDVAGAVAKYDAIAAWNPLPSVRADAGMRAAMVVLVERADTAEAKRRFSALLATGVTGDVAAEARDHLGRLLLPTDPAKAGASFLSAYKANPKAPAALDRLRLAGEAFRLSNDKKSAFAAWDKLAKLDPARRSAVWLAEADWRLSEGEAEPALVLYEKAAGVATTADERRAARLGAASCHERLGDLDEALAAFDEADLPDEVGRARLPTLRARADGTSVRPAYTPVPRDPPPRRRR